MLNCIYFWGGVVWHFESKDILLYHSDEIRMAFQIFESDV